MSRGRTVARHDREGVRPRSGIGLSPEVAGCAGRTPSRSCLATVVGGRRKPWVGGRVLS